MDWNLFIACSFYVCMVSAFLMAGALMYFDENGSIQ